MKRYFEFKTQLSNNKKTLQKAQFTASNSLKKGFITTQFLAVVVNVITRIVIKQELDFVCYEYGKSSPRVVLCLIAGYLNGFPLKMLCISTIHHWRVLTFVEQYPVF